MGWSGKKLIWGDEPQDVVDDAIDEACGLNWKDYLKLSPRKRDLIRFGLLDNTALRKKVDEIYDSEWSRAATDEEYDNLIKVGLHLGGQTLSVS